MPLSDELSRDGNLGKSSGLANLVENFFCVEVHTKLASASLVFALRLFKFSL